MEWWVFALITMLCFSLANIALKEIMNSGELENLAEANKHLAVPLLASVIMFLAAAYFAFLRNASLSSNIFFLAIGFLVLAGTGFLFLLKAVASGQIAPVTAIVSTSSVTVAVLSVVILKDSLSVQQVAGILLTFGGVLILTLSG